MQVAPFAPDGGKPSSSALATMLLPDVLQLLQGSPAERLRDAQAREQTEERLRRRDADYQDMVASAANAPRPLDVMIRAERNMLPGSRAAQRDQLQTQLRQELSQEHDSFRQALADASARGKSPDPPSTTQNVSPKVTNEPSQPASPESADAPGKPSEAVGAQAASPAANPSGGTTESTALPGATRILSPAAPVAATSSALTADVLAKAAQDLDSAGPPSAVTPSAAGNASKAESAPAGGAEASAGDVAVDSAARPSAAAGKAPAGRAAQTESPAPSTNDANLEQILRLIRAQVGKDRSVATLHLDPPELGKIKVQMDLRHELLSLRIDAETEAARRLLSDQLDALRRSLEATGIQLERVEVRVPEGARNPVDPQLPQHADAWSGFQDGTARREAESAAGGQPTGTESTSGEPGEISAQAVGGLGPAAESLVNIWA